MFCTIATKFKVKINEKVICKKCVIMGGGQILKPEEKETAMTTVILGKFK